MFLRAVTDQARLLTGGRAGALCLVHTASERVRMAAGSGGLADRVGDEAQVTSVACGPMLMAPGLEPPACRAAARCEFAPPSCDQIHVAPITAGSVVRGALCVMSTPTTLRRDSGLMLTHLAGLASACLAGERLYLLAARLGALTERQRIAADLHDGVAQRLAALQMQVDRALGGPTGDDDPGSRLSKVREAVAGTTEELRAMIDSLGAPRDRVQAPAELGAVVRTAARDAGIGAGALRVTVGHDVLVPRSVAAEVRRIVMEALANAHRHAQASSIQVRLHREAGQSIVSVADNGSGFTDLRVAATSAAGGAATNASGGAATSAAGGTGTSPATSAAGGPASATPAGATTVTGALGAHFGLETMRLRAAVIGGALEIRSALGGGTEVILRWPETVT